VLEREVDRFRESRTDLLGFRFEEGRPAGIVVRQVDTVRVRVAPAFAIEGLRETSRTSSRSSRRAVSPERIERRLATSYLHANDIANTTAPVATAAKEKDSAAVKFAGGNLWKSIGGWQQ
jgi:hypothetical protein